jgi:hypothetical protein
MDSAGAGLTVHYMERAASGMLRQLVSKGCGRVKIRANARQVTSALGSDLLSSADGRTGRKVKKQADKC